MASINKVILLGNLGADPKLDIPQEDVSPLFQLQLLALE